MDVVGFEGEQLRVWQAEDSASQVAIEVHGVFGGSCRDVKAAGSEPARRFGSRGEQRGAQAKFPVCPVHVEESELDERGQRSDGRGVDNRDAGELRAIKRPVKRSACIEAPVEDRRIGFWFPARPALRFDGTRLQDEHAVLEPVEFLYVLAAVDCPDERDFRSAEQPGEHVLVVVDALRGEDGFRLGQLAFLVRCEPKLRAWPVGDHRFADDQVSAGEHTLSFEDVVNDAYLNRIQLWSPMLQPGQDTVDQAALAAACNDIEF